MAQGAGLKAQGKQDIKIEIKKIRVLFLNIYFTPQNVTLSAVRRVSFLISDFWLQPSDL